MNVPICVVVWLFLPRGCQQQWPERTPGESEEARTGLEHRAWATDKAGSVTWMSAFANPAPREALSEASSSRLELGVALGRRFSCNPGEVRCVWPSAGPGRRCRLDVQPLPDRAAAGLWGRSAWPAAGVLRSRACPLSQALSLSVLLQVHTLGLLLPGIFFLCFFILKLSTNGFAVSGLDIPV